MCCNSCNVSYDDEKDKLRHKK
ncbi:MAG: hypothetical protein ACI4II_04660 [Acutalibacteraceae bacterium]